MTDLTQTNELLEKLLSEIAGLRKDFRGFQAELLGGDHFTLQDIGEGLGAIETLLDERLSEKSEVN